MANVPLTSCQFRTKAHGIVFAIALAVQMLIAPNETSAKGGRFSLHSAFSPVSRAEAGTVTSSPSRATTSEPLNFGACGGKRYRDPNTHKCRGPADIR